MVSQWTAAEARVLRRLKTPALIQRFLDEEVNYNKEIGGNTCLSPRRILRERRAQCMEGALFAASALRFLGYPPLLMDLEATRDTDHVIAIYKKNGAWGALGKSNFSGLRLREPIYRTLRELAMSYFEGYFNLRRQKTLRSYSQPVDLRRFDSQDWERAEEFVWFVPEHLCEIPHTPLLTPAQERELALVDRRLFDAGKFGSVGI